jgi:protein ImuB
VKSAPQQFGLFETALRDPNQLYETLTRLTGLLGTDRVGTPVLEDTHRPDAFRMEPFSWQLDPESENGTGRDCARPKVEAASSRLVKKTRLEAASTSPTAALRRFRPGLPAFVLLEENKPVHLRGGEIAGTTAAQKGPYAASGNWWDDKSWTRQEWDLHLSDGPVLRCYEHGNGWQVDGIYD